MVVAREPLCDRVAIRARRWVDAERDAREDAAGAEARGAALDEARASVADDLLAALRDAPTPDAAQCAALALASPAVLRGFLGGGRRCGPRGGSSAASASIASSSASIAASATDAIASTFARGGFDGAERGACLALGVVAGACHAGDRERRAAAMETLASRAFSRDAIGDAAAGAAAEGLGPLARSLGIAVAADGPGAGAWRAEMLRDAASRFDRLRAVRRGGGTRVRGVLRRRGGDWRDVRGDGLGRGAFGERRWTPARRRRRRAPRRVCP